jgi:hypothetical protein
MVKSKGKSRRLFEIQIPIWILWAVIVSFVYAVSIFVAYDVGKRAPQSQYGGIKGKEVQKKGKGNPITVPLFIPTEKVSHHPRFHFTFDSEKVLRPLRNREQLDKIVTGVTTDIEVFRQLMAWVRSQWSPGRPDPYPPIDAIVILDKIRAGETGGFCAQYCFVLVQCLQSLGYKARYVTIKGHEVTEVWSPGLSKWVMLDPLYELYIQNGDTPLSVIEIHNIMRGGENDLNIYTKKDPGELKDYISRYEKFAVWCKNDHVSFPINFFDIERYKIYFLDDPNERMYVPAGSPYTFFPEDLYFNVSKR